MVDRVRIKKYLQSRVDNLAKRKGIPISKLVEDAILLYLSQNEGQSNTKEAKTTVVTEIKPLKIETEQSAVETKLQETETELTVENYTGGIEI